MVMRLIQAIVVWLAGSAQARRRAWRGFAVILTFLGALEVAGCSSSSPDEQPADPALSADPAHPVRLGPTGRYLVDQHGVPFLILGE